MSAVDSSSNELFEQVSTLIEGPRSTIITCSRRERRDSSESEGLSCTFDDPAEKIFVLHEKIVVI